MRGEGRVHPEKVTGQSQGYRETQDKQLHMHALISKDNYVITSQPAHISVMFLNCERTLEYLERTCKLYAERPQGGI